MKKKVKQRYFCGMQLTAAQKGSVDSLIGMTVNGYGLKAKSFKAEEAFWTAIKIVTGKEKAPNEDFITAVRRIQDELRTLSSMARRTMRYAVDQQKLFDEIGAWPVVKVRRAGHGKQVPVSVSYATSPSPSSKDEFYKSWEWRTIRMKVIKEFGRACQCCGATPAHLGPSGNPVRIVVDHIKPLSKFWELRLEKSNLQILCDECNQGKGNWDESDYRPSQATDEWVIEDDGVSPAIREQLDNVVSFRGAA